jgi:hypothetical protein
MSPLLKYGAFLSEGQKQNPNSFCFAAYHFVSLFLLVTLAISPSLFYDFPMKPTLE